ncbi:MAG: preprotein translocase subunit SecA [Eubacteriales bacterium]|nr:preprotein translocase subunit SecA [Eubacteriales bacterium]
MSRVTDKIFGSHSEREVKRIRPLVQKIEGLRPEMQALSDEELRGKTKEFRERLAQGATLDDLLPEAYAAIREGAKRALGMEPFQVQLIGGIILHQGRIAEMKTGEGKTLVATLPTYLNALEGKGVHVVTVNDYLANRDAHWMGQVYEFMGLTVGVVLNSMTPQERKAAYACDITYVTNNELGFDYLRDNMAIYKEQLVLRDLHYAIIDEVDSILIDEARTPLIISGQSGKSTKIYEACDILAKQMKRGEDMEDLTKIDAIMGVEREETGDFIVNEKDKVVNLTAEGVEKVEKFFRLENLADPENLEIQHCIILALRANNLMARDHDYIVKDDQVLIVDEFTGRVMPGRRYSDGLHQAIEAKEHVKVKRESKTLATITFQNFFNKFEKKAGMTGTALTEEKEFRDIYGMDVIEIPTNRPIARIDQQDAVYKTKAEKKRAIVEAVKEAHEKGQPVLVGTITIEASEELSGMLRREGIQHNVLNAKFHELEAEIVAQAGQHGAVTIATNMAGRGTDIKLDEEARAAGGLRIIGTERHESRRIDNQLRGRSGRQGDPGESKFYISLEDDLMRLFGSERMITMFNALGIPEGQEIAHKSLTHAIEQAQKKIELNNFGIRKNLLDYDQVMNEQREIIYDERRRVLNGDSMRDSIYKMITDIVENAVDTSIGDDMPSDDWNLTELNELLLPIVPLQVVNRGRIKERTKNGLKQQLKEEAVKLYESKEAEFPEAEMIRELERVVLLKVIDKKWMDHIDDMEQLRQGIGLQAYGQRNPLVEYKMTGYEMFNEMTQNIMDDTVRLLFHVRIAQKMEREQVAEATGTNKDAAEQSGSANAAGQGASGMRSTAAAGQSAPAAGTAGAGQSASAQMPQNAAGQSAPAAAGQTPQNVAGQSAPAAGAGQGAAPRREVIRPVILKREPVAKITGTNRDDSMAKEPVKRAEKKVYPNDPCPCGSGKKYKNCCGRNL